MENWAVILHNINTIKHWTVVGAASMNFTNQFENVTYIQWALVARLLESLFGGRRQSFLNLTRWVRDSFRCTWLWGSFWFDDFLLGHIISFKKILLMWRRLNRFECSHLLNDLTRHMHASDLSDNDSALGMSKEQHIWLRGRLDKEKLLCLCWSHLGVQAA